MSTLKERLAARQAIRTNEVDESEIVDSDILATEKQEEETITDTYVPIKSEEELRTEYQAKHAAEEEAERVEKIKAGNSFAERIQAASKKIYLHKQLHFANQPKN